MVNFKGTNLVTTNVSSITTGQTEMNSSSRVQITATTGPLAHGIFLVAKDSSNYYIGNSSVTAANGVKVSANNPLFIPISDPSSLYCIAGADSKTLSWICY